MQSQVWNLPQVCKSFPENHDVLVDRDHVLTQIESFFERNKLVVYEGESGAGSTTLLAQFALANPRNTISLFIKTTSRMAYDPDVLREDLCQQLNWALREQDLPESEISSDVLLRNLLNKLSREAKRSNKIYYFVVDGLDKLSVIHPHIMTQIAAMLPWGVERFRLLLSGQAEQLPIPDGNAPKTASIPFFSSGEVTQFFEGIIDETQAQRVYRNFKLPGRLATVRRLLLDCEDRAQLLDNLPRNYPILFEMEWEKTNRRDAEQSQLLALLAHDHREHTVSDLSDLTEITPDAVQEKLERLRFIELKPHGTIEGDLVVEWASEEYREFAANKLHHLRKGVQQLRIDKLIQTNASTQGSEATASLIELTNYLEEANRHADILNYLNPETLSQMLDRSHSLALVQRKTGAGIQAAVQEKLDGPLMQLSIQQATLNSLEGAKIWSSEIEAHIALGDFAAAQALTQATTLHAERFHQLAVIAKARDKKGLPADLEISEEIAQLFEMIDPTELGEDAVEIASDLLSTHPDLAMQLVEKANQTSGENALDWAFARLSVAAMATSGDEDEHPVDSPERLKAERLRNRIQDPGAQQFSTVASLLYGYGKYSAKRILDEVAQLNSAGDQLFVLRNWAMGNAEHENAAQVLEGALDILIGTTDYVPTARDLRQLAAPLPFLASYDDAKKLVARFAGLRETLEHRSTTDDDIALQLLMARTEVKYDTEAAGNRMLAIYFDLCDVSDLTIKSGCLARLMSALSDIDLENNSVTPDDLLESVRRDLEATFESILQITAEQHDATKAIIRPLIRTHPDLALQWIARLNTHYRRDAALLDFVTAASRAPESTFALAPIEEALRRFKDKELRDVALLRLIRRLDAMAQQKTDKGQTLEFCSLLPTLSRVKEIEGLERRCLGYCLALSLWSHHKDPNFDGLRDNWHHSLEAAWNAIDAQWQKIDVGFKIVAELSEQFPEQAELFMKKTSEVRRDATIDNGTTAGSYLANLYLSIRTYAGLLPRKVATPNDYERLVEVIEDVPSSEDRIKLWSDLALRCHLMKEMERCNEITDRFIRPLLARLHVGINSDCHARCVVISSAALYVAHGATGQETIQALATFHRNEACESVCRFLLYSSAPSDPCTPMPGQGLPISWPQAADVCVMLNIMTSDGAILHYMTRLVDCVLHRSSRITGEQRTDLIGKLEEIAKTKLPAPDGIEHQGYCIACHAQIARLKSNNQNWEGLINAGRQLPNTADIVHVLCTIAAVMPPRSHAAREDLLEEIRGIVATIPTLRDRFERYELLAETADRISPDLAKKYIKEAMENALKEAQTHEQQASAMEGPTGSGAYTAARRFIDLAHRINSEYATHLMALADTEPVRQGLKSALKERVEHLNLRKRVADERQLEEDLSVHEVEEWSRLAWSLLGQLNAGRLQTWRRSEARDFVRVAALAPIEESYSLLSWTFENTVRRHRNTDQARELLHPLFEATLQGAQLALRVSARSASQLEHARQEAQASSADIIDIGERAQALERIETWIEKEIENTLKICDPYLGPSDVCDILRLVSRHHPDCQVEIMISYEHLKKEAIAQPWQETFKRHWRHNADQSPPDTQIIVIGFGKEGKSPIHARWWLTENSGLSTGTSYNGFGSRSDSIEQLSYEQTREKEENFDKYAHRRVRDHNGERISVETFTMD